MLTLQASPWFGNMVKVRATKDLPETAGANVFSPPATRFRRGLLSKIQQQDFIQKIYTLFNMACALHLRTQANTRKPSEAALLVLVHAHDCFCMRKCPKKKKKSNSHVPDLTLGDDFCF